MADFFEIDFLDVEAKSSGDAICIRYEVAGQRYIHVVDGGFQSTGEAVVKHINAFYDSPARIEHVVATHNDGDHAVGLQNVLETYNVGALWMLRPWVYAEELLPRFKNYTNAGNLRSALRKAYSNLAALEDIAVRRGITIYEPFQGSVIGAFRVMAPTRKRFLDLVVDSDKTPVAVDEGALSLLARALTGIAQKAAALVSAAWGAEYFPAGETSNENEMSVVQYAYLSGFKIMLTGDTGRSGLREVIEYAPLAGLSLPGIDRFQVPHHGGRHNVSSELLDQILGKKLDQQGSPAKFSAFISSAKADEDHPRKSVVRAVIHRGGMVYTTESTSIRTQGGFAPQRSWGPAVPAAYPEEQES
ncbi:MULTISPECIES: MBL fold metallo-hydrolase [unclassified Bradyrhizobium]|uniref:MBL fold metallo-hydrolase n=1 Tax=unclassified Bradyrhizobium TaxID=2631580 RepID=UPI0028E431D5|nr:MULTISPECIES: MBL fold metallo-hydrolase [unclassified Bradyrhizobium]